MKIFILNIRLILLTASLLTIISCTSLSSNLTSATASTPDCSEPIGYELVNGQILSMDSNWSIHSAIRVKGDRIIAVGDTAAPNDVGACYQVINLEGKTVIPGLIDSHIHYIRAGGTPGIDLRGAENSFSIASLLQLIQRQASIVATDKPITIIGGINPQQFTDKRFPTLKELDTVAPEHLFYAQQGFAGPAFTNSLGKQLFNSKGIKVDEDGRIAAGQPTVMAYKTLKATQTQQDRIEGLQRLQHYANSLGLTTVADQGGVPFPGAGFFDPVKDYQAALSLWQKRQLTVRIRAQRLSYDNSEQRGNVEAFLDSAWPQFGDDFFKITALGEHIVSFPRDGKVNPAYTSKIKAIAAQGWSHEQHSTSAMENKQHIEAIELIHETQPIDQLRWSLAHVFELGHEGDLSTVNKLKAMGMGLRLQNHGYSYPTDRFPLGRMLEGPNSGPLYRTLMDSGIKLGAGSDGPLLGPLNPWLSIYYMVTGKNSADRLVNPKQTLSRMEALSLYTADNAWFTFDEENLGSLEVGKVADLVILNKNYLSVPLEEIKTLHSVMTMVAGDIVYADTNL